MEPLSQAADMQMSDYKVMQKKDHRSVDKIHLTEVSMGNEGDTLRELNRSRVLRET